MAREENMRLQKEIWELQNKVRVLEMKDAVR